MAGWHTESRAITFLGHYNKQNNLKSTSRCSQQHGFQLGLDSPLGTNKNKNDDDDPRSFLVIISFSEWLTESYFGAFL